MTSKIEEILEILDDGKWHRLSDLRAKVGVTEGQFLGITCFLSRYEFMKVDYSEEKARIEKSVREFLTQKATL